MSETQKTNPDAEMLTRAQAFVDWKFTARSSMRLSATGLNYIEADRTDLAREFVSFAFAELERAAALRVAPVMIERAARASSTRMTGSDELWPNFIGLVETVKAALEDKPAVIADQCDGGKT